MRYWSTIKQKHVDRNRTEDSGKQVAVRYWSTIKGNMGIWV